MSDNDQPKETILDEEEQWYEDHADEFVYAGDEMRDALIAAAQKPPRVVAEKKKMVSVRLAPSDIAAIKARAKRQGIPYQTMLSAIFHQVALGDLVNINDVRPLLTSDGRTAKSQ